MRQSRRTTWRARELRRESTRAEVLLWNILRRGALGAKFRRQHPVAGFITDFCCSSKRLVIEVDGESHRWTGARDTRREAIIRLCGFKVIRFAEREVYENLAGVVEAIEHAMRFEE
ncbi:MAG: endonuclease domain-containing protein [Phycisphaerae bacterium]|nr:endonuclease domain-containing protein [Phycisphaerae bacterium]